MAQLLSGTRIYGTATIDTQVLINGTVAATSTITGALQVVGGVGIGKDLWIGGNIYGSVVGTITTATNIAGGLRGQLVYQQSPGVTSFVGTGTIGQLLMSSATSAPLYVNTSAIFVGYSDKANNLGGGTIMSIPYQSTTGSTAYLAAANTAGWILTTNGTGVAPAWVNPTTAVSPSSLTVQANVAAFEYVVGVAAAGSAQNAYIATTSSGQIGFNASTGFMALGTTSPVSKLHINETSGVASQIRIEGHANSGISMYTPSQGSGGFIGFDGSGNFGINQKNSSLGIYFSNSAGTNRLYITANGGISFNGTTNYGSQYQILQSNGDSAPTWISVGALTAVTSSTQINTVGTYTNASFYPTFVNANNSTPVAMSVYTTSSFYINASTGVVTHTSNVSATSTSTGALQVVGGVGIGGNLWVGGTINGNASSASAATSVNTIQQASNAVYYPTFVNANNASALAMSVYTTSSFTINPMTGNVGIGTLTPTAKLHVQGTGGGGYGTTNKIILQRTDATNCTGSIEFQGSAGHASPYWNILTDGDVANDFGFAYNGTKILNLLASGNIRIPAGDLGLDAGKTIFFGKEESFGGSDTGGSDWGYITFDNNNSTYGTAAGETSCLRIGSSNDGTGSVGDHIAIEPAADLYFRSLQGGSVYVGTLANRVFSIDMSGNVVAKAEITAYGTASDVRLKENIVKLEGSLLKVQKLQGYNFNYIGKKDKLLGVIAQEIEQVIPEVVYEFKDVDGEMYKAVRYEHLTVLLIEAMNEQQAIIEQQQIQIDQIQSMLTNLINK